MKRKAKKIEEQPCPCGSSRTYVVCCGRYLDTGEVAATAEDLMRSRYTAYVMLRNSYLLASWHESTRPLSLSVEAEPTQWRGLQVLRHEQQDETSASVEFIARYKVNGRAQRLHELSRFLREDGRWFYVDGKTP